MKYVLIILIVLLGAAALYFKDQILLSPHDSYYSALLRENLKATAERWRMEAEESLAAPLRISLPYSERRLLEADYLQPITFAFDLKMDELVQVNIFPSINTRAEVFVDVFYVKDAATEPKRIASMAVKEQQLKIGAEHTGQYLVRIQPSHAAQGLMDITITSPLRYGFPVDTESENAVQSFFGGDRDGGARRHEGIDIFAPRVRRSLRPRQVALPAWGRRHVAENMCGSVATTALFIMRISTQSRCPPVIVSGEETFSAPSVIPAMQSLPARICILGYTNLCGARLIRCRWLVGKNRSTLTLRPSLNWRRVGCRLIQRK